MSHISTWIAKERMYYAQTVRRQPVVTHAIAEQAEANLAAMEKAFAFAAASMVPLLPSPCPW